MSTHQATMKLPRLRTRKVWLGAYGGHYDAVVVFHARPRKTKPR